MRTALVFAVVLVALFTLWQPVAAQEKKDDLGIAKKMAALEQAWLERELQNRVVRKTKEAIKLKREGRKKELDKIEEFRSEELLKIKLYMAEFKELCHAWVQEQALLHEFSPSQQKPPEPDPKLVQQLQKQYQQAIVKAQQQSLAAATRAQQQQQQALLQTQQQQNQARLRLIQQQQQALLWALQQQTQAELQWYRVQQQAAQQILQQQVQAEMRWQQRYYQAQNNFFQRRR